MILLLGYGSRTVSIDAGFIPIGIFSIKLIGNEFLLEDKSIERVAQIHVTGIKF